MPRVESITLEPPSEQWRALAEQYARPSTAERFREQLGLPTGGLVVMGGHQAGFWHPGVLAKVFAVQAAARAIGATPAWLVVDHDTNAPEQIRYPIEHGGLADATWSAAPAADALATGSRPAIAPTTLTTEHAPPFVADGLTRMRDALGTHPTDSLADQFTSAALELADAHDIVVLRSRDLARTDLFAELLDDGSITETYNNALADNGSTIKPIDADELPIWRIARDGARSPVRANDLASISPSELAPRALLMTGMIRLAGCDLFVHGTGGGDEGGYDKITEKWFADWLGAALAPSVVATATACLPLDADAPTEEQIEHAKWLAHNAKHNPALLDDTTAAEAKAEILARAERAKADKQNPAPIFAELQALLGAYRERHADRLAQLSADAERLESRRDEAKLAHDRTWAFPLYPAEVIDELRERIGSAFAAPTIARAP